MTTLILIHLKLCGHSLVAEWDTSNVHTGVRFSLAAPKSKSMKLVSLNIWGGRVFTPFLEFIKAHASDTDIFCLQEVFQSSSDVEVSHGAHMNVLEDIKRLLPDHDVCVGWAQANVDNDGPVDFEVNAGLATFLKKPVKVLSQDNIFIYGRKNGADSNDAAIIPANMLCTKIQSGKKEYMVCNLHGYVYPGDKLDTEERIEQSGKIIHFLSKEDGKKILCGDFNLLPGVESLKMLEKNMENLILKFNIPRTRSELSLYFGTPQEQKHSDYILISPDIEVIGFQVPNIRISDHLPMILHLE